MKTCLLVCSAVETIQISGTRKRRPIPMRTPWASAPLPTRLSRADCHHSSDWPPEPPLSPSARYSFAVRSVFSRPELTFIMHPPTGRFQE